MGDASAASASYSVYGLELVSTYHFRFPLPASLPYGGTTAGGEIEQPLSTVRFEVAPPGADATAGTSWPEALPDPVFDGRVATPNGTYGCAVHVMPDLTLMRFNEGADFSIQPGRVTCRLLDERYGFAIEIWLLGTVLAYVLEGLGTPALHASAVEVGGAGVGFLASNKGGKSSLAAAFVREGHRLLSDDLVGLRLTEADVSALPGYPQMRMWPEQAQRLVGSTSGLTRVQPAQSKLRVPLSRVGGGGFCPEPRPLSALYLPDRDPDAESPVRIERLGPAEAMTELARHSYLGPMLPSVACAASRFRLLARVLSQVPVVRLRYPSGFEHLPGVVEAVSNDVARHGDRA